MAILITGLSVRDCSSPHDRSHSASAGGYEDGGYNERNMEDMRGIWRIARGYGGIWRIYWDEYGGLPDDNEEHGGYCVRIQWK